MIVVSDTSPLISLAATGYSGILKQFYEQVIIPEAVYQEITGSDPELPGASEVQALEWIISQPVQNNVVVHALPGELDYGEAAAIALAVELQAELLLIGERRARVVATRLGLNVVGGLGGSLKRNTRLKPILDDSITQVGFRISPQLSMSGSCKLVEKVRSKSASMATCRT